MRIPLTSDGWREMTVATILLGAATAALAWWYWPLAVAPIIVWLWAISFFRDPHRAVPGEPGILVAPADGKVTEIVDLDHDDDIGGPARRVSIFLSVFNVHINRSPCAARVRSIQYRRGEFVNAMRSDSSHRNEANTLVLDGADGAPSTIVVTQIAGAIARRIVCHAKTGDPLGAGQRFGMIKFGSRTELTIPKRDGDRVVVRLGQAVRAGETIMIRLAGGQ
ncbi:MAG: phosphatidylserine decarboxylase family protein [Phycisphaerae bacterium]|nr:phosphatidylserine decarboxylase family protein [Phycisphaerae bacterium]